MPEPSPTFCYSIWTSHSVLTIFQIRIFDYPFEFYVIKKTCLISDT